MPLHLLCRFYLCHIRIIPQHPYKLEFVRVLLRPFLCYLILLSCGYYAPFQLKFQGQGGPLVQDNYVPPSTKELNAIFEKITIEDFERMASKLGRSDGSRNQKTNPQVSPSPSRFYPDRAFSFCLLGVYLFRMATAAKTITALKYIEHFI